MIYEVSNEGELEEDFATLAYGMRLLQYDYIGGHGSRGYGKVHFANVLADCVVGDIADETMDKLNDILKCELEG
jgi:CRISPR-associated protein Csm3